MEPTVSDKVDEVKSTVVEEQASGWSRFKNWWKDVFTKDEVTKDEKASNGEVNKLEVTAKESTTTLVGRVTQTEVEKVLE